MAKEHSVFGQFFFGCNPSRTEREEKVLRYIIHRINENAALHEVLEEHYVRRNCSQLEIDEIQSNHELVRAAREHLGKAFRSGELDPWQHRTPGSSGKAESKSWQSKKRAYGD